MKRTVLGIICFFASMAQVSMDPHLVTLDKNIYSFYGFGEFVLLRVGSGDHLLEVQVRMTQTVDINNKPINASIITSVSVVNRAITPEVFQFDLINSGAGDYGNITIRINGTRISSSQLTELINGTGVRFTLISLLSLVDGALTLQYEELTGDDSIVLTIQEVRGILQIDSSLSPSYNRRVVGLNGYVDENQTNDFRYSNGTTAPLESLTFKELPSPTTTAEERWNMYIPVGTILGSLTHPFGESWRTNISQSLFTYTPGASWSTYNDLYLQPQYLKELLAIASNERISRAAAACSNGDTFSPQCMQDVLITNDPSRGQLISNVVQPLPNFPPQFNQAALVLEVTVKEKFTLQLHASDPEGDSITFSLAGDIASESTASITSSGLFTWTPTSVTALSVVFLACDASGASSQVNATVYMCACANNGTCTSSFQSGDNSAKFYVRSCTCTEAWDGNYCEQDKDGCSVGGCFTACRDVPAPDSGFTCDPCPANQTGDPATYCYFDYCASSPCDQDCVPGSDGPICICRTGYMLKITTGTTCDDVDECSSSPCTEANQVCVNTVGSFKCVCQTGYTLSVGSCVDVNECSTADICNDASLQCFNTEGSYICACNAPRYTGNPPNCTDVDECSFHDICSVNENCVNTVGSFKCDCSSGFTRSSSNARCVDMNECDTEGRCPPHPAGVCNNYNGGYSCDCIPGYIYNVTTNACDDRNECLTNEGRGPCSHTCVNSIGSYTCSCSTGYQLAADMKGCGDVDECVGGLPCPQICINNFGSFACACREGFHLINETCVANMTCNSTSAAKCINSDCFVNSTTLMPECACRSGYSVHNATYCVDIDECNGINNCDANANCTNTPGSLSCSCNKYYTDMSGNNNPRGTSCTEILAPIVGTIAAGDVTNSSVRVAWSRVFLVEQFTVYLTTTDSSVPIQETNLTTAMFNYTFCDLTPNTTYIFHIFVTYHSIPSRSTTKAFTTDPYVESPTLGALQVTESTIKVVWTAAPLATGYRVTITGKAPLSVREATEHTFSGLTAGTIYDISVVTLFGTFESDAVSRKTNTAPAPPQNLMVTFDPIVYGKALVTWMAPDMGSVEDYFVWISPNASFVRGAVRNISFSSLTPGLTYSFRLASRLNGIISRGVNISFVGPAATSTLVASVTADTAPSAASSATTSTATTKSTSMASTPTTAQTATSARKVTTSNATTSTATTKSTSTASTPTTAQTATSARKVTTSNATTSTATTKSTSMASTPTTAQTATSARKVTTSNATTSTATTKSTSTASTPTTAQTATSARKVTTSNVTTSTATTKSTSTASTPTTAQTATSARKVTTSNATTSTATTKSTSTASTPTTAQTATSARKVTTSNVTTSTATTKSTSTASTPTTAQTATSARKVTTSNATTSTATTKSTSMASTPTTAQTATSARKVTTSNATTSTATTKSTSTASTPTTAQTATTAMTAATSGVIATASNTPAPISCPQFSVLVGDRCVDSLMVVTTITITQTFTPDLNDPTTTAGQDILITMSKIYTAIYKKRGIIFIRIISITFSSGSIVAESQLELANLTDVSQAVSAAQESVHSGELDEFNVKIVDVKNLCVANVTDCSASAICSDSNTAPGYTCQCNPGFRNKNATHPGRRCEAQCEFNGGSYCMNGATCETTLRENPTCKCTQWYEGARCESTKQTPITAVGVVAAVLLIILVSIFLAAVHNRIRTGRFSLRYDNQSRMLGDNDRYRMTRFDGRRLV